MVEKTPNHGLNRYEPGERDWSHSEDMETAERLLPIRDVEANLEEYVPYEGATFVATDTGAVYDGDGQTWSPARREVAALRSGSVQGGVVEFGTLRDGYRFEMVHLNSFNVGGDGKQEEVIVEPSDYTDKPVNKVLLYCEHMSVWAQSGDQTFAVQYNDQTSGYENWRIDGSHTTDDYAIVAKNAGNAHPFMGNVWIHCDRDFMLSPDGGARGATVDGKIDHVTHDKPDEDRPLTVDKLRFFTPDGDQIRMRRATLFGFTPSLNE